MNVMCGYEGRDGLLAMGINLLEIEVADLVNVDWQTTLVPSASPLRIL